MTHPNRIAASLLLTAALLIALTTYPSATTPTVGSISGQVTSNTTALGLANAVIQVYDLNADDFRPEKATTDSSGNYTLNLPPGTYAVLTQNTQGYINEIYPNVPCSAVCDTSGVTFLELGTDAITGIDFGLDPGGRISGTVTNAANGQPIAGIRVFAIGPGEFPFATGITDASGNYITDGGSATGNVWILTENNLGFQNEAYDDVKCLFCDFFADADPVAVTVGVTTTGINFALDRGGQITGTVTDSGGVPLTNTSLEIRTETDSIAEVMTDASGNYSTAGFPAGTYYVVTDAGGFFVDELYNNLSCPGGFCNQTSGTAIPLTVDATASSINFALAAGGKISGTVTAAADGSPLQEIDVNIFNASGAFITSAETNSSGVFTTAALPPGNYYAVAQASGTFGSQLYDNLPCVGFCNPTTGTPITVVANQTTGDIDFALNPGATISGTVTNASTGLPVSNYTVQLQTASGGFVTNVVTDASGGYSISGIQDGSYYVRTTSFSGLINEVYNNVMCVSCNVVTSGGSLIAVTAGATVNNIDFALDPGGRISGTITNASTAALLQNIGAQVFNASAVGMGTYNTNASGVYTSAGLPPGTYYLRTSNTIGFVNELYDNISCPQTSCQVLTGAPIVVTANTITNGINFALAPGGSISGVVTSDATGLGIQNVQVQVFSSAGQNLGSVNTSASGSYTTSGLPAGTYYLRTSNNVGFVDELYNNLACFPTCTVTSGTPVVVSVGATVSGVNFGLPTGGGFSGVVTDANTAAPLANHQVQLFSAAGSFLRSVSTAANGSYSFNALAAGTYYARTNAAGSQYYQDELFDELPCPPACNVTTGTPITVTVGNVQTGIDFTLSTGAGTIAGTVTDASTGLPLSQIQVQVFTSGFLFAKSVGTSAAGTYSLGGLTAGTYYVRTAVNSSQPWIDQLYDVGTCFPSCLLAGGTPVVVSNGATTGNIDFALAPNLIKNGRFDSGTSNWLLFATPDMSNIVSQVVSGVFEYYRVAPPPGTPGQAVIFQQTGVAVAADTALHARFSLGNSSSVRKRISVLAIDSDFSDIAVCTFWLPANLPMSQYEMKTNTRKAWANAALYFYAATAGQNGGFYRLDNVALEVDPEGSVTQTECVDALAPDATDDPDSATLLTNGNFSGGMTGWGLFGQIVAQVSGAVFEFYRPAGQPAGVVLQQTAQATTANEILTATFQLGNSSGVTKRVTVIMHDNDFSDLSACTFYLAPGQPLSDYAMQMYATEAWTNATFSVYGATAGTEQWIRLDNVTFKRTPSAAISGTHCHEPGSTPLGPETATFAVASLQPGGEATTPAGQARGRASGPPVEDDFVAVVAAGASGMLRLASPVDLGEARGGHLVFDSWLSGARGDVQASVDGSTWITLASIDPMDGWWPVAVNLDTLAGHRVALRFVVADEADGADPPVWRVRNVRIIRRER